MMSDEKQPKTQPGGAGTSIDYLEIKGLHGHRDLMIHFEDNKLILVGENGTGKTTILRLFHYFLSGQWQFLAEHEFKALILSINGVPYGVPHSFFSQKFASMEHLQEYTAVRRLSPRLRTLFWEQLHSSKGELSLNELKRLCGRLDIPFNVVAREIFDSPNAKWNKEIDILLWAVDNALDFQLLYLPTYRRIEQELSMIFESTEDLERHRRHRSRRRLEGRSYVELIEFGMGDVEQTITGSLEQLKEFAREGLNALTLGYLGDVVDEDYKRLNVAKIRDADEETIGSVLERIDERVLSVTQKKHLLEKINAVRRGSELDEHSKVICHYFLKLLQFQEDLKEKESQITAFCDVCTEYMGEHKTFTYDTADFKFSIKEDTGKGQREIELSQLSSGEKQIVSLFCHLYLSGDVKHFVVIDEPELSLSVPWQRRFLLDVAGGASFAGMVAATHSPFIYDNDLKCYAHGLGEFEVGDTAR